MFSIRSVLLTLRTDKQASRQFLHCPQDLLDSLTKMNVPTITLLFVYSKSEYTIESVSVSGHLHDNS